MALNTITGAPEGTDAVAQLQTLEPANALSNAVPGPPGAVSAPQPLGDLDFFNRSPMGTLTGGLPPEATTYTQDIPPYTAQTQAAPRSLTASEASDEITRQLQEVRAKQSSFMPQFIATLAALKGDFRPAFQLEEQKRKTAQALGVIPLIAKARIKAIQGDAEGATSDLTSIMTNVSDRNPELGSMIQKGIEQIIAKNQDRESDKNLLKVMQQRVKENPNLEPLLGADIRVLQQIQASGTTLGKDLRDEMFRRAHLDYQVVEGQVIAKGPGGYTTEALPAITRPSDIESPLGLRLAQAYNLTPPEVANVLNGRMVSPYAAQLRQDWIDLQPFRALLDLNKGIVIEPSLLYQHLIKYGAWNTALRTFGGEEGINDILARHNAGAKPGNVQLPGPPGASGAPGTVATGQPSTIGGPPTPTQQQLGQGILQEAAKRQAMVTGATGREAQQVQLEHPLTFQQANQALVDVNPNINQFGKNYSGRMLSAQDVKNLREKPYYVNLEPMDRALWQNEVQPDMTALRDLRYIQEVFKAYGNPETVFDRTRTGVGRMLGSYIGASLTPGMTAGTVAELLANRAIERLGRTQQIDVKEVGTLKKLMSGPWANKEEALAAIPALQQKLVDRIEMNTGHRVSVEPSQSGGSLHDISGGGGQVPGGGSAPEKAVPPPPQPYSIRTEKGQRPIQKGDIGAAIERYGRKQQGLPPIEEAPVTVTPTPAAPPGPTEITITPGKPVNRR